MPYPAKLSPERILEQAASMLDQGPENLSMRTLAAALGVRASSLYGHFPDRAALEGALADQVARTMQSALQTASSGLNAEAALRAGAHAYLHFARTHPHWYALLLAPHTPVPGTPGAAKDLWNLVLHLVSGVTGIADDTSATVALWSFLHGFLGLEASGQFGLSGPLGGFETGLNALIEGFRPVD